MTLIQQITEQMSDQYQIYQDLDGCLADFEERFEHFTGLLPDEWKEKAEREYGEKMATDKFWDIIDNQVGMRFWRGMSWMPQGQELWDYIKQHNPIILTAPSIQDCSKEGKTLWVKDNLGDYEVIFSSAKEKPNYSGPNKILIDDREDTILDWKARNGIGILYKGDTQETIRQLKHYGI